MPAGSSRERLFAHLQVELLVLSNRPDAIPLQQLHPENQTWQRLVFPTGITFLDYMQCDWSTFLSTAAGDCLRTTYDRSNGNYTNEAFSGAAADELRINSRVGCRFCKVDFQSRI